MEIKYLSETIYLFLAYIIGSIPFSQIVAKKKAGIDLRFSGEGNVGARNVFHLINPVYGVICFILDMSKGLIVFFITKWLNFNELMTWLMGISVFIGHSFPVFLKGKGGKGAATVSGFLLGLSPIPLLLGSIVGGIAYLFTREFHWFASVALGSFALIFMPVFNHPFDEIVKVILYMFLPAIKRIIDIPYRRKIISKTKWKWS